MGGGGKVTLHLDANGNNPKGTSLASTISLIFKSFMGAGALALPALFMHGGVASTTAFLWVLACIAVYAIHSLVEVSNLITLTEQRQRMITRIKRQKDPTAPRALPFEILPGVTDAQMTSHDRTVDVPSFSECGMAALGSIGWLLVEIALAICQVGICIAYVIFVSTNLLESIGLLSRVGWIIAMTVPTGALLLIPDLKKLSFVGVLGNIVYLLTVGIIVYVGSRDFCCIERAEINWNDFTQYGTIFGTCSFALEGIAMILPIKAGMRNPRKDFAKSMNISLFLVVLVYWSFGLGSYLLYGSHTKSPILSSLPPKLVLTKIAKIALSASIFLSFPLQFFPIREFIDKMLARSYYVDERSLQKSHDLMNAMKNAADDEDNIHDTGLLPKSSSSSSAPDDNNNSINSKDTTTMLNRDQGDSSDSSNSSSPTNLQIITHNGDNNSNIRSNGNNYDNDDDEVTSPNGLKSPKTPFPRDLLEHDPDYEHLHRSQESIDRAHQTAFNFSICFRFAVLALVSFVAVIFPNFSLIIALFGALANSSLAFVFPSIFWLGVMAFGRRYIMNSRYIELAKSPHITQITAVYSYTRHGDKIDLETILEKNMLLLESYSRTAILAELNRASSPEVSEMSPLHSRTPSYGSIESEDINIVSASPNTPRKITDRDLYESHDIDSLGPPTISSPNAFLLRNRVATAPTIDDDTLDTRSQCNQDNYGRQSSSLSIQVTRKVYTEDDKGMEIAPMEGKSFFLGWIAFPATIVVVGIVASAIGVVDSIKDIIKEFSH